MKLGLLADVHGNHFGLAAAFEALDQEVDRWLFLGDVAGYYPFVHECLALMATREVIAIRGNHDEVLLDCATRRSSPDEAYRRRYGTALERGLSGLSTDDLQMLRGWPPSRLETLGGLRIMLVHGAPWDPFEGRVYPDFGEWGRFDELEADVVIMGHTHYPLEHRHSSRLLINPGSAGQARHRSGAASCAVLDTTHLAVRHQHVPYDVTPLIQDARAHDPGLPYLWEVLTR